MRDIDAFVALFAADYDSRQPAHPDRAFTGSEQVRANWTRDLRRRLFRSELIGAVADGETLWTEWHWQGTGLEIAGVIVFGVRDDLFAWARLYVEPVEQGEGIEAAVRDMSGR